MTFGGAARSATARSAVAAEQNDPQAPALGADPESTDFLPRDDYEAVVIGSGFGGAVAACRLAQAGIDVAVIERGRRFPPGSFARDLGRLDSGWLWAGKHGLYDIRPFSDMLCVVAAGYGGGSLAYANVAIRPPPEVFERAWPSPYRRPVLDPYYDLAAHMLAVRPVQPDAETGALPAWRSPNGMAHMLAR
jgi:cholesterol oxidase